MMLQLSQAWVALIVDVSLKSLLLAVAAGLVMAVLRIRNINLRHRVWTSVLLSMLCLPIIVPMTPGVPLPRWMSINAAEAPSGERLDISSADKSRSIIPGNPFKSNLSAEANTKQARNTFRSRAPDALSNGSNDRVVVLPDETKDREFQSAATSGSFPTVRSAFAVLKANWPIGLVIVHGTVAFVLLFRLGIGVRQVRRLVRGSQRINSERLLGVRGSESGPVRNSRRGVRSGVDKVQFLENAHIQIPRTMGLLRPVVVLPADWKDWTVNKQQSVISHELAHVRRADWLVLILGEMNRAVYWFHPLAWRLPEWLSDLAEQNCDDAVIESSGDRTQYARHLLEVASRLAATNTDRTAPVTSVAMARGSRLKGRIDAILDDRRPLARRIGALGSAGLMLAAIPTVLLAAAITTSQSSSARTVSGDARGQEVQSPVDGREASREGGAPESSKQDGETNVERIAPASDVTKAAHWKKLVYEGQVVTPDGEPAENATLHLVYWYSDQSSPAAAKPLATTGVDGRFRFEMKRDDFLRTGDSVPPWQWASLVAVAGGYGMTWAHSLAFETTGQVAKEMANDPRHPGNLNRKQLMEMINSQHGPLRLAKDDVPVRGRVVNTEGEPIQAARISLLDISTGKQDSLDDWLAATKRPRTNYYSIREHVPKHIYGPLARKLLPTVTSNREGWVELHGIGRDRVLRLLIEGPGIATAEVYSRTREGERIAVASGPTGESMAIEGPVFTHVAAPSRKVAGVVRDQATGDPLAGVMVTSFQIWRQTASARNKMTRSGSDYVRAVTDTEGRYQLLGLPNVAFNPIVFSPNAKLPYLSSSMEVDTSGTGTQAVNLDADLVSGVVIEGQVTDSATGQGVAGEIEYLVARENPKFNEIRKSARVPRKPRADMQGRFRIVAPPGPGYLAFRAFNDAYEKTTPQPKDSASASLNSFTLSYLGAGAPKHHALAKIDFAASAAKHQVKLNVRQGRHVTGTIVDPQGQPIVGGQYVGRNEVPVWRSVDDSGRFVIVSFDPRKSRQLAFVSHERKLAGAYVLKGLAPTDLKVTLQPWGTIQGRVVDDEGEGIAGMMLVAGSMARMVLSQPDGSRAESRLRVPLPPFEGQSTSRRLTDDHGRFKIEGVVPGMKYDLSVVKNQGVEFQQNGDIARDLVLEPGQTIDLGDVRVQQPDLEAIRRQFENASEKPAGTDAKKRPTEPNSTQQ